MLMSDPYFVKLMDSLQVRELISMHPLAFAILSLAAQRAKWSEDSKSKLEIGEAMIAASDFDGRGKNKGMTRQTFRTNLNKLVNSGFATIKSTNEGTLIKIITTDIYDINRKSTNQRINQQVTSKQPLTENIERRKKNTEHKKNIRTYSNAHADKIQFLDHVFLTQAQHDQLALECGDSWPLVLQRLNNFIPNKKGEPYRCHASAIRTWVMKAVQEEQGRKQTFQQVQTLRRPVPAGIGKADPVEINMEPL